MMNKTGIEETTVVVKLDGSDPEPEVRHSKTSFSPAMSPESAMTDTKVEKIYTESNESLHPNTSEETELVKLRSESVLQRDLLGLKLESRTEESPRRYSKYTHTVNHEENISSYGNGTPLTPYHNDQICSERAGTRCETDMSEIATVSSSRSIYDAHKVNQSFPLTSQGWHSVDIPIMHDQSSYYSVSNEHSPEKPQTLLPWGGHLGQSYQAYINAPPHYNRVLTQRLNNLPSHFQMPTNYAGNDTISPAPSQGNSVLWGHGTLPGRFPTRRQEWDDMYYNTNRNGFPYVNSDTTVVVRNVTDQTQQIKALIPVSKPRVIYKPFQNVPQDADRTPDRRQGKPRMNSQVLTPQNVADVSRVGAHSSNDSESPDKDSGEKTKIPERYSDHEDLDEGWRSEDDNGSFSDAEMDLPSPPEKGGGKAKLVTLYRNGDPHFPAKQLAVNHKTMEALLINLNDKYPTTAGVKFILTIPDGREVKTIQDFQHNRSYAISSTRALNKNINYGDIKPAKWTHRKPSAGPTKKLKKWEKDLFRSDVTSRSQNSPASKAPSNGRGTVKPRILTIVKNTDRQLQEKVILNPQTSQSFEEILADITAMLHYPDDEPVQGIYTQRPPHKKVKSFSDLVRNFRDFNEFLACGSEGQPLELLQPTETAHDSPQSEPINGTSGPRKKGGSKTFQGPVNDSDPGVCSVDRWTRVQEFVLGMGRSGRGGPQRGGAATKNGHNSSLAAPMKRRPAAKDPALLPTAKDDTRNGAAPLAAWKRPYRQTLLPQHESVTVDIHNMRREFFIPQQSSNNDGAKPDRQLKLNWVYGYRGRDASNNLHVLMSGELVYYVSTVAVVYDRKRNRQLQYTAHTEDITCIAIHPTTPYVATGQLDGRTPEGATHVRIWDARSLATLAILGLGFFTGGVTSVAFSFKTGDFGPDGFLLMAVDDSEKHVLSVWDWQSERMVARTPNTAETVVWGCFHPQDCRNLVTFGRRHVFFWRLFWESEMGVYKLLRDKKSGLFEKEGSPRFVTSVVFAKNDDVITGDSAGRLMVWSKDYNDAWVINEKISEPLKAAHSKSIFALCILNDGTLLSGGGSEIKAWDTHNDYRAIKIRMPKELPQNKRRAIIGINKRDKNGTSWNGIKVPESAGFVRTMVAVRSGAAEGNLLLGTTNNCVLEGSLHGKFSFVVQGHSDELWAVATDPDEQSFVTAGYDQQVIKWSASEHKIVWKTSAEKPCTCVAIDPSGRHVAVGTTVGRFILLSAHSGQFVISLQVSPEQVDCVKYSPDGNFMAIGCHDNYIQVFNVLDDGLVFRKHKQCSLKGHRSFVSHIDWSRDARNLMSIAGDYETLYWDVDAMSKEEPSKCRDMEIDSQTGILHHGVLGAWSNLKEGEDINALHKGSVIDHVVVGDNRGKLRIYKYPCSKDQPPYLERKAYSGHVTQVRFTHDDSFLISTGGIEAGVLQWSVVDAT